MHASVVVLALGLGLGACEQPPIIIDRTAPASKRAASEAAAARSAAPQPAAPEAATPEVATGGAASGAERAGGSGGSAARPASSVPAAGSGTAGDAADAPSVDTFVRQSAAARLIAIGDVHGDLEATRAALRLGGAIDAKDGWIGGELTVVQTGDQLDRGDDEREIIDLFDRLERDAKAAGGRFIALNGNHETMNVQGDFRYVTPAGFGAFEGVMPRSPHAGAAPASVQGRAAAFLPGGAYAVLLAKRDVVAVIDDSVFVHGGVLPEHVAYGLERINRETRAWMQSGALAAPASIASERAPVWVRDYSLDPLSAEACSMLGEVLEALKVKRMVVGHTVQQAGITSACGERVWRIDVGLARYYGAKTVAVLEISGGVARALTAPR